MAMPLAIAKQLGKKGPAKKGGKAPAKGSGKR